MSNYEVMLERYVDIKTVSRYTSLPVKTLYEWAGQGKIPSIKMGRRVLFDLHDIDQIMVTVAGVLSSTINRKSLNTSPWLKLVKKDRFPDEMSDVISVLVFERQLPTTTQQWNDVVDSTGTGPGSCVPAAQLVELGSTTRTYNLQQSALESPPLCVWDLRFAVKRSEQLANMEGVLTENSAWAWIERYRSEYVRVCGHKRVTNLTFQDGGSSAHPNQAPTSLLKQGHLDTVYMQMIRDGAGLNPLGRDNGMPQFGVIISPEASESVKRENANIREDFRNSNRVNELLAPLGVDFPYKGFYHFQDPFCRRFSGQDWANDEVPPYIAEAATKGNRYIVNPAYETALYEEAIVFHQDVMTSMVPAPITAPGGKTQFEPQKYMGDWKWLNIQDAVTNPDKTIGYFRGLFSNGTKEVRPEWGTSIIHVRCGTPLALQTCADYREYGA